MKLPRDWFSFPVAGPACALVDSAAEAAEHGIAEEGVGAGLVERLNFAVGENLYGRGFFTVKNVFEFRDCRFLAHGTFLTTSAPHGNV